jgi:hypothetical protein
MLASKRWPGSATIVRATHATFHSENWPSLLSTRARLAG